MITGHEFLTLRLLHKFSVYAGGIMLVVLEVLDRTHLPYIFTCFVRMSNKFCKPWGRGKIIKFKKWNNAGTAGHPVILRKK